MSPIADIQRRLFETGRIRIGKTVPAGKGTRPTKLDVFRFTTRNRTAADYLAKTYGGEVQPWNEAPTDKQWEVISQSAELRVMVPPESMAFSQFYELWKAGGCERRCDGERLIGTDGPCLCDQEERECKPHTRLSVMLAEMPSSGLWRLDTSGFYAASELSGAFELARLIAQASGRAVLGATLRLEQREVKRPQTGTRKFAVPVLDFDVDAGALVGEAPQGALPEGGVTPLPALPAPSVREQVEAIDTAPPKTPRANAAERVRPTGVKVRRLGEETEQSRTFQDAYDAKGLVVAKESAPTVPPPKRPASREPRDPERMDSAESNGKAKELSDFFDQLHGRNASLRWSILHEFGWRGGDAGHWIARRTPDELDKLSARLLTLVEAAP